MVSFILALSIGSVPLPVGSIWQALTGTGDDITNEIVLQLRLPRALSAFSTGGLLALSGALLQVLLGNPLAEPYLLGVSGGAAVGALSVLALGLSGHWIQGAACLGAMVSTALVFGLSRSPEAWNPTRLLLTGVVVAAGLGALVGLLLAISPEASLRGMLFWLMGDLGQAQTPTISLITLIFGVLISVLSASRLNILSQGEYTALALGVSAQKMRLFVYFLSSLLTGVAVTEAGSVGFVGLIIPHLVRLSMGTDHRFLLPAVALLGGSFLLIADTVARTVAAPQELPVGVITALLGVPAFLILLRLSNLHSHGT